MNTRQIIRNVWAYQQLYRLVLYQQLFVALMGKNNTNTNNWNSKQHSKQPNWHSSVESQQSSVELVLRGNAAKIRYLLYRPSAVPPANDRTHSKIAAHSVKQLPMSRLQRQSAILKIYSVLCHKNTKSTHFGTIGVYVYFGCGWEVQKSKKCSNSPNMVFLRLYQS